MRAAACHRAVLLRSPLQARRLSAAAAGAPPPPSQQPLLLPSTEALYAGPPGQPCVGPYASHRAALDYGWHGRYTAARQLLQDGLIARALAPPRAPPPPPPGVRPWLVHTAGAMGAGKSHALRCLAAAGAFPLACFVCIDPDEIKGALPEARAFVAAHRASAGTRLHKESLLVADVLTRAAMAQGRNVLVDGSMRNTRWHAAEWARLKATAPHYRVAVLLVTAPAGVVHARAARRAAHTGREIPTDVIDDSIARAPESFAALRPLADFAAVIDSGGAEPRVLPPDTLESFQGVWGLQGCGALREASSGSLLAAQQLA